MATTITVTPGKKSGTVATSVRILFVCRANTGRSQMAAALYQDLTDMPAESRGYAVEQPGKTLDEAPRANDTIAVMDEEGIDIRHCVRQQLHESDLANFDLVVVLAPTNEWPDWLQGEPDVIEWSMSDPVDFDRDQTRITRDDIKERVKELVLELE